MNGVATVDEERLADIEAKLAHQELMVTELSDVMYRQQRLIEQLEQRCENLLQRCRALENQTDRGMPEDEPPPHY